MSRIFKNCLNCGEQFDIPQCRDFREHCCSSECKREYRSKKLAEGKASRERNCLYCGAKFIPRQSQLNKGDGKYCSKSCLMAVMQRNAHTKDANSKRGISFSATMLKRFIEKYPSFKGKTTRDRRIFLWNNDPSMREKMRTYRKSNPHKIREYNQSRARRKYGKLPKGTIHTLLLCQRGKCAICRSSLAGDYHVDHVMPLSLGGFTTNITSSFYVRHAMFGSRQKIQLFICRNWGFCYDSCRKETHGKGGATTLLSMWRRAGRAASHSRKQGNEPTRRKHVGNPTMPRMPSRTKRSPW